MTRRGKRGELTEEIGKILIYAALLILIVLIGYVFLTKGGGELLKGIWAKLKGPF